MPARSLDQPLCVRMQRASRATMINDRRATIVIPSLGAIQQLTHDSILGLRRTLPLHKKRAQRLRTSASACDTSNDQRDHLFDVTNRCRYDYSPLFDLYAHHAHLLLSPPSARRTSDMHPPSPSGSASALSNLCQRGVRDSSGRQTMNPDSAAKTTPITSHRPGPRQTLLCLHLHSPLSASAGVLLFCACEFERACGVCGGRLWCARGHICIW